MALTVSLGLFSGYQNVIQDIIIGVNSHIYIMKYENELIEDFEYEKIGTMLDSTSSVQSYAPYIYSECMSSNDDYIAGIILRGINYEKECEVTQFQQYLTEGSFNSQGKNIVIGDKIAKRLHAEVGDTISLISPLNANMSLAGMIPKTIKVCVSGIFSSGMYEFDNSLVFINMNTIQNFLDIGNTFSGISIRLTPDQIEYSPEIADSIRQNLSFPFYTSDWKSMNKNLFSMLELEKWVIFIIIALIVIVAGFGLTSVLIMNIFDRRKEIGILKSMGATNKIVQTIFFSRNILVGFSGIILGMICGSIFAKILTVTNIIQIQSDVYMIDRLVVKNHFIDYLLIFAVASIIVFVSASVPLKRIKKMDVVSIINETKR